MGYQPVDLHKKKGSILVVHCSDPRFQAAYRQIIDNLDEYYDLVVFPGASKAIVSSQDVMDNIKLLHDLHHFEIVHILDHIECGAFGLVDDELKAHRAMLAEAEKFLKEAIKDVAVVPHLAGEKAEVEL